METSDRLPGVFMDRYRVGEVDETAVEKYIEQWVDDSDPIVYSKLPEYLGMTDTEFIIWAETGIVVG